jgi:hypothetical protein
MVVASGIMLGDEVKHNKVGKIVIEGIVPHCGDYALYYYNDQGHLSWVYLKNCEVCVI